MGNDSTGQRIFSETRPQIAAKPQQEEKDRCGIVLAAGEGLRLQRFIRRLRGDALPKQYVNFMGTRSMLEHTLHRAEKLISPNRLFTVVSREHLRYPEVQRQLSARPEETVVVQPKNKETAPGLLLPLMRLYKRYPDSTVVVFPSDHFIVEEDLFMHHVSLAFRVVESDPSLVIILGIEPNGAEPEYGYILADEDVENLPPLGVRRVRLFIEKPKAHAAQELVRRGAFWNTMVMVFRAETFLALVRSAAPALYAAFRRIWEANGTSNELHVVEEAYRRMEPLNFSKGFLQALPPQHRSRLSVLPVRGVFWSDWGSNHRIVSALRMTGHREGILYSKGICKTLPRWQEKKLPHYSHLNTYRLVPRREVSFRPHGTDDSEPGG